MFKKLFGTDGIRGEWADKITPELAFEIGKAVAIIFERADEENYIVIGRDTRLSSEILECSLIAGITSMGTNVIKIGVIPTAVVPFSISYLKANAGIMITASHNSSNCNGFKFFNGNGFRISNEQEYRIEHIISNSSDYAIKSFNNLGRILINLECVNEYVKSIKKEIKCNRKLKICFDCANGASSYILKKIFKNYDCKYIDSAPNGININDRCGATYIKNLVDEMKKCNYDIGFSFDGDADRIKVVLNDGKILSGEDVMYHLSKYNRYSSIVTTKMTNMALIQELENENIRCHIVDIGENAVLKALLENLCYFGAENNGHYIILNKNSCSDGLLIAAQIISILNKQSNLAVPYTPYHQYENSIKVKNKKDILNNSYIKDNIELCESILEEKGRILVRASGTEDVIRILVEGESKKLIEEIGQNIEKCIKKFV